MSAHAKLSASGAHRWMRCPGSIARSEGYSDESSIFAAEGTVAHEVASDCLEADRPALDFLGETREADGFSFEVNHEMVEKVQLYLDYCNSLDGQNRWVETRVCFDNWVKGGFGTSDHIKIHETPVRRIINVGDLKYGKGEHVLAENNEQGMIYGLGVIQDFDVFYGFKISDVVNIAIHQPRIAEEPSEWRIAVGTLLAWAANELAPAALATEQKDAPITPGAKQCRWCPARGKCPEEAAWNIKQISPDFKAVGKTFTLKDKNKLTNAEIGALMEQIPAMRKWADAVEAYGFNELTEGRAVPGYKLVTGKAGNKKWTFKDERILLDLQKLGIPEEEVVTKKISTPTAVEKILKTMKKKPKEIENLWNQSKGKPTIAKRDDKRKEIESPTEAAFKAIPNQS